MLKGLHTNQTTTKGNAWFLFGSREWELYTYTNEHNNDRIKLFDGGVWSNIAEPNAGQGGEYKIHTRNSYKL